MFLFKRIHLRRGQHTKILISEYVCSVQIVKTLTQIWNHHLVIYIINYFLKSLLQYEVYKYFPLQHFTIEIVKRLSKKCCTFQMIYIYVCCFQYLKKNSSSQLLNIFIDSQGHFLNSKIATNVIILTTSKIQHYFACVECILFFAGRKT